MITIIITISPGENYPCHDNIGDQKCINPLYAGPF